MNPCSRCKVAYGRTCCELPRGEIPTFGLTNPEVDRILSHVGKAFSDCFEVDDLTAEERREFVRKSKVLGDVFSGGKRIRLKIRDNDTLAECVFLKSGEGCSLPENIRPHACRLYPFWFEEVLGKGLMVTSGLFSGPCYAKEFAKSGTHLLSLFNTTKSKLLAVFRQLLADAAVHSGRGGDEDQK